MSSRRTTPPPWRRPAPRTTSGDSACVEYSPDGRTLAVSVAELDEYQGVVVGDKPLQILDAASLETVLGEFRGVGPGGYAGRLWTSAPTEAAGLRPWSGAKVARAIFHSRRWSGTSHDREAPILRVPMPGHNGNVELSPDGQVLYITQRTEPIRAIDVETGRGIASRPVNSGGERGVALALSEDGATLANASVEGIQIRDSKDLSLRITLVGASEGVSTLNFTLDGRRLAAGYSDGNTIVWEPATPKPLQTLRGHAQEVWEGAFSPDGGTYYTVSRDGQLIGWDLAGARGFPPWRGYPTNPHVDNPFRAIPSPDGQTIAYVGYGSPDGRGGAQLRFRDVASGRLTTLRYLPFYGEPNVSWSPDSQLFLTGGGFETFPSLGITQLASSRPGSHPGVNPSASG